MLSAVCLGETMAMLTPAQSAPLHQATELLFGIGGAESNVAMGLAAMGLDAHWIGRVGRDGFGTRILNDLQAHRVGTSGVEIDPDRPTGLYVKIPAAELPSRGRSSLEPGAVEPAVPGGSSVLYYRQGSAASAMGPATLLNPVVASLLRDAALIHLSGITAALSPGCAELSRSILGAPREGRTVSFDVNWRPALWADKDPAILAELANLADVVLMGSDEAALAFGTDDETELRRLLPDPAVLVIKNADISAVALNRDGSRVEVPALAVEVLEPVGAGDAFAAGYLSGLLMGLDQKSCLRRGHISAAATLTVRGDRGPLPADEVMSAVLACSDRDWAMIRVAAGRVVAPTPVVPTPVVPTPVVPTPVAPTPVAPEPGAVRP
ncbi:MAG TPA: sugar kinase [Micrococcaceae bacterium]|jgi:2-dehydro-3-deoxygluconokinase